MEADRILLPELSEICSECKLLTVDTSGVEGMATSKARNEISSLVREIMPILQSRLNV